MPTHLPSNEIWALNRETRMPKAESCCLLHTRCHLMRYRHFRGRQFVCPLCSCLQSQWCKVDQPTNLPSWYIPPYADNRAARQERSPLRSRWSMSVVFPTPLAPRIEMRRWSQLICLMSSRTTSVFTKANNRRHLLISLSIRLVCCLYRCQQQR